MNDTVIQTRGLTRYFGDRAAVLDLALAVPRGTIFAFLGRNGSGKSTTIKMLLGMLPPHSGEAAVLGCDCRALTPEIRERIGYLAEDHPLYGWMTIRQINEFQAASFAGWNQRTFDGVLDHFGLRPSQRVRGLSRGERAGLALALTLAPDPELLILDDPAMGLDPVARRLLVESMIYLTRRQDRTIFFSSHEVSDVERVADWIGVLDHGVLQACCRMETFRNRVREVRLLFDTPPPTGVKLPGALQIQRLERELRVICVQTNSSFEHQFEHIGARSVQVESVSLEDALVSYLGGQGERANFLSQEARP